MQVSQVYVQKTEDTELTGLSNLWCHSWDPVVLTLSMGIEAQKWLTEFFPNESVFRMDRKGLESLSE